MLPVQLFLRNQVGESYKQGIQAAWSTPIHPVKWWISRFRGTYRALAASEVGLFFILLEGLRPLCNVTRSSVLVAVGVLYLPLAFYYYCYYYYCCCYYYYYYYYCIINITFIANIIFIISIIIRIFIRRSLLFFWVKLTVWFCFFQFLHLF